MNEEKAHAIWLARLRELEPCTPIIIENVVGAPFSMMNALRSVEATTGTINERGELNVNRKEPKDE